MKKGPGILIAFGEPKKGGPKGGMEDEKSDMMDNMSDDGSESYDMMCDEVMSALKSKDTELFRESLKALISEMITKHMENSDEEG